MEKSITPNQIKQNNRSLIYHFIYKNRKVSQQDISYALHLSRPTVTANLSAMEEEGKKYKILRFYNGKKCPQRRPLPPQGRNAAFFTEIELRSAET